MPLSTASSDSARRSDRASDHEKDEDEEMEEEQPAVAASAPRGSDGNSSAGERDEDDIINAWPGNDAFEAALGGPPPTTLPRF